MLPLVRDRAQPAKELAGQDHETNTQRSESKGGGIESDFLPESHDLPAFLGHAIDGFGAVDCAVPKVGGLVVVVGPAGGRIASGPGSLVLFIIADGGFEERVRGRVRESQCPCRGLIVRGHGGQRAWRGGREGAKLILTGTRIGSGGGTSGDRRCGAEGMAVAYVVVVLVVVVKVAVLVMMGVPGVTRIAAENRCRFQERTRWRISDVSKAISCPKVLRKMVPQSGSAGPRGFTGRCHRLSLSLGTVAFTRSMISFGLVPIFIYLLVFSI